MRALLVSLALAAAAPAAAEELRAGTFDPPRMAPDFSLKGSDGADLKLSRYRGKVVALGFGFTNCELVCPTTLSTLAKARKRLGASGDSLQVVYVTVDPERDNPQRMREYLAAFDATFVGGTGTPQQLGKVQQDYGILVKRISAPRGPLDSGLHRNDTSFDHSSFVYLIDRDGKLRALSPYGRSADDVAHDVALLLKK